MRLFTHIFYMFLKLNAHMVTYFLVSFCLYVGAYLCVLENVLTEI